MIDIPEAFDPYLVEAEKYLEYLMVIRDDGNEDAFFEGLTQLPHDVLLNLIRGSLLFILHMSMILNGASLTNSDPYADENQEWLKTEIENTVALNEKLKLLKYNIAKTKEDPT